MTTSPRVPEPAFVLVPGHWLGAWAWDDVSRHLVAAGRCVVAVTLPGLDPDDAERHTRTLPDQAAALVGVLEALAGERGPSVVVAHSGANAPVSLLLDRRPELVDRVVWVDSGPVGSDSVAHGGVPDGVVEVPLPSFDELAQQASLDGLSDAHRDEFRRRAVPQPASVLGESLVLETGRGAEVPTTLVCCSIDSDSIKAMVASGQQMFSEVAKCVDATYVDLPTGHWPMWSRPGDLAVVLVEAADA